MTQFRKKPVVIDAYKIDYATFVGDELPMWLAEAVHQGQVFTALGAWQVKTLEGDMIISDGDFIIQGVQGEIYPCKPEIFKETYEAANGKEKNDNIFTYHKPNSTTELIYAQIRAKGRELSELIDEVVPGSREQALAKTKVEEAIMWANAGVARNIK